MTLAPVRRRLPLAVLGLLSGLVALYLVAWAQGRHGEVPRGVRVGAVDVGGTGPVKAAQLLQAGYAESAAAPIPVRAAGLARSVPPAAAGLRFDPAATVQAAAHRSWDPWSVLRRVLGLRTHVRPRAAVDASALAAAVASLADGVDRPVVEAAIGYRGTTPVPTRPRAGLTLDRVRSAAALQSAYLVSRRPVDLPARSVPSQVGAAELDRVLAGVATPAVAAPVGLRIGSRTVPAAPADLAAVTTFAVSGHTLAPRVDGTALQRRLGRRLAPVYVPARDASFAFRRSGRPVLVPARAGRGIAPAALATAVLPALPRPAPRTVPVALTATAPALSTAAAQRLGIKQKISSFTTYHPCCASRVTNIHKISDIVSGALVLPGKTFSLNGYVGERDRARGFVSAPMIDNGAFRDSVGGGVSQFATTIFNAVFFAGLQDVQHKPHSYWISRYPMGRESTVSYPQPDFRFRNDSPTGVLIQATYTGTSVTVTFWGTKRYAVEAVSSGPYAYTGVPAVEYNTRPDCESSSGGSGFSVDVTRIFKQRGTVVKRQTFHTRYLSEPLVVCGPPPAPAASPSASVQARAG